MVKATPKDADLVIHAIRPMVDTVLLAKAHAQLQREKIDKIRKVLLLEEVYIAEDQIANGAEYRLIDPGDSWHLKDADAKRFYAACDKAYAAEGYDDLEPGYCPALIAESLVVDAQHALIEAAYPFFEVETHALLCAGLDKYREYIELLTKMVVNAPGGYKNPLDAFLK